MAISHEQRDKLGRLITIGNWTAYPVSNHLAFGKVIRIGPKMIIVEEVTARGFATLSRKYPGDILKIEDGPEVTMYMLSLHNKSK